VSRLVTFASAALWMVTALVPLHVEAQEVTVSTADLFAPVAETPTSPGLQITLSEAVQLTIRHQPRVEQAAQAVRAASGLHQSERGFFDTTVRVGSGFEYTQQPVLPFLMDLEVRKRDALDLIADTFTDLNIQMRDMASGTTTDLPRCPFDIDVDTGAILLRPPDEAPPGALNFDLVGEEEKQLQGGRELPIFITGDLEDILSGFRDLCSRQIDQSFEQALLGRYYRQIDFAGDLGIEGALISGSEAISETFPLLAEISEAIGARARLGLERLGELPEDQFRRSFSLSSGFTKPFRSGLTVSGSVLVQSTEENYRDKILDPTFGGLGLPPQFPSHVSLSLDLPLGKGLGATTVAAPERSARAMLAARQEQLRHTVAEEVYRTVLAYLHLVAAQESVELLEESAARHERYVALVEQRVAGEELARIELDRARARSAAVASSLSAARGDLAAARVSLAEAAGLESATLAEAPLASESFAEIRQALPAIDDLLRIAAEERHDTRALAQARDASDALARAARSSLRRTFDLSFTGGLSNLYESPFPRFLPDEEDPIFSELEPAPVRQSPARFYSPRGFYRSISGRWEPFVIAQLTVNFPFGNNAAKGRLAQAESSLRAARIQLTDQGRVVRQNVVEVRGTLETSAAAIEQYRETIDQVLETRDGSQQLFEAGELTLIDTLLTEEEAITDQLTLVRQMQMYLSTLARLKFESGEIVTFANEGTPTESVSFTGADFVK
jgi:outer membrane protein TolC